MTKLILTRCGAFVYAVAAPMLALLLCLLFMIVEGDGSPFVDMAAWRPIFLVLVVWMAIGLCTWAVLASRVCRRQADRSGRGGAMSLLWMLLMWFPAAAGAPVLYVWNLIWLVRGRYPVVPWPRHRWYRFAAVGVLLMVLLVALAASGGVRSITPAATAEAAFRSHAQETDILARIPQEDGSVLMIAYDACGVVEETADGWVLREACRAQYKAFPGDIANVHACFNRSQTGREDVVVVCKTALSGVEHDMAAVPPRDSAGSAFTPVKVENGWITSYYYYAFVDVDAPGYELYPE